MGFPTAFIGGFTLTATTLYLTVTLHKQNRLAQIAALQQSNLILRNIVETLPPAPPAKPYARVSFAESVKDRWNEEVEGLVRRVQRVDWKGVGEEAVDGVLGVVRRVRKGEGS